MKKTEYQRRAYAWQRLSRAVDRSILATNDEEKKRAKKWADLWAKRAGI